MRRISALAIAPLLAVLFAVTIVGVGASAPAAVAATPAGGFNNFACRPSAVHPRPVILLHGLGGPPTGNWAMFGPALAAQGYCAFASPYGAPATWPVYGLEPIDQSAHDVATYIDQVLAATGASQVDLVGHSEGAFLSLYVPKELGYGPKVHTVVAMAPPTHGTSFAGLVTLANQTGLMPLASLLLRNGGCGACADLVVGGPAITSLNTGPVAVPGVQYTVIATRFDELVRNEQYNPATDTAFVREPGVANEYVQDACPFDPVGHVGLAFDTGVLNLVTNALDPSTARPVACSFGLPL